MAWKRKTSSPASPNGAARAAPRSSPKHEIPTISEGSGIRYLHFGTEWVQGAMWVAKPTELVLEYTAQMMAWLLFLEAPRRQTIGLLGLGAGSLARFCLKHTSSPLRVVEWNPLVTSACELYFKLPRPSRMLIEHLDAGAWVADAQHQEQCAVLMVDLYDGDAAGPVRDSLEFYQQCREVLSDVGVMTVNLFGAHASFQKNIRRLNQAFEGRLLSLPQIDAGNQVILAFKGPPIAVSIEQLLARAVVVESQYGLPAQKWVRSMIGRTQNGILTI